MATQGEIAALTTVAEVAADGAGVAALTMVSEVAAPAVGIAALSAVFEIVEPYEESGGESGGDADMMFAGRLVLKQYNRPCYQLAGVNLAGRR